MNDVQFVRRGKAGIVGFCTLMICLILTFALGAFIDSGQYPLEGMVVKGIMLSFFIPASIATTIVVIQAILRPKGPPKLTDEQKALIGYKLGMIATGQVVHPPPKER